VAFPHLDDCCPAKAAERLGFGRMALAHLRQEQRVPISRWAVGGNVTKSAREVPRQISGFGSSPFAAMLQYVIFHINRQARGESSVRRSLARRTEIEIGYGILLHWPFSSERDKMGLVG
jgi:hypothetical protein